MKKLSPLSVVASVLGAICIIYYLLCGFMESFRTPGLWIWISFGLILISGVLWKILAEPRFLSGKLRRTYKAVKGICLSLTAVFLGIFLLFEGFVIGSWIGSDNDDTSADAVIVLGAAVDYDRPDDTLALRITEAYDFIKKNPDSVVIACGGLGEGDIITEAECIKSELVSMGIDSDRILTEDKSTSTAENFRFAASLLPKDHGRIAVVTTGFHAFRAITAGEYILSELGIKAELYPVTAPCPTIKLPCSMVREFAAFTKSLLYGDIGL